MYIRYETRELRENKLSPNSFTSISLFLSKTKKSNKKKKKGGGEGKGEKLEKKDN